MGFINLEATSALSSMELTVSQKNGIVDDFILNKAASTVMKERHIPVAMVTGGYGKIMTIRGKVLAFMREQVLVTPEVSHLDEETGEKVIDTAAVYNTKPVLRGDLEELMEEAFPGCSVTALDYVVDKVIANSTTTGTWTSFKSFDWTPST